MVEKKLAAASQAGSLETSAILQESLESPMPEVRTTALRWAMASKQSGPAALARALMDNHPMVQGMARQMLFETVADQMIIEEIMNAVDENDWATVEATLYRIY